MTKVTIDIRNIASSTHADDRVFFRSPVVREAPGGGLINTANEVVTLTDGVGDVELTPGPVIVTFQCKGVADTAPKRGVVPTTTPATLLDVLGDTLTYEPEVLGMVTQARNDAIEAIQLARDQALQAIQDAQNGGS